MQEQYHKHANQLEEIAVSIIDMSYEYDKVFTYCLLEHSVYTFNHMTLVEFAETVRCKSFLASRCVQRYLQKIWYGNIDYTGKYIDLRIIACTLSVPLIPIFFWTLPYVEKDNHVNNKICPKSELHNSSKPENHPKHRLWCNKIISFYRAPIVRFYHYAIFFILFLILFSGLLLVNYFPLNIYGESRSGYEGLPIPTYEIILHVCIWCLICEEIRQFLKGTYHFEKWNILDISAIIFYLVGFTTRFFRYEETFIASKIFMCLDLILWFVRTLHLFVPFRSLGLKLIMIFNTMRDLFFFVCFILVFLFAFSMASWSLLSTDSQVYWYYSSNGSLFNATVPRTGIHLWSQHLLRNVTNYGVWKIFGQVETIDDIDAYSYVAFVLDIIFVAIANVLLLNVLVALFNVTIRDVEERSKQVWGYERYLIINEYKDKPSIPPPLGIPYILYSIVRSLYGKLPSFSKPSFDNKIEEDKKPRLSNNNDGIGEVGSRIIDDHMNIKKDQSDLISLAKDSDSIEKESKLDDDHCCWYTLKRENMDQIVAALEKIGLKFHNWQEQINHK